MNDYEVLKLVTGVTVIGKCTHYPETIEVTYPLEVVFRPIPDETGTRFIGEHMMMRPFLALTDASDVVLDSYNVLTSTPLSKRLYSSYEEMVENVYRKNLAYSGAFLSESDREREQQIIEEQEEWRRTKELEEILEELKNDVDDEDKTIH